MDNVFGGYFGGRRVLVTGHTGFKGSWLCSWLLKLGAEVHGVALDPEPHEVLYDSLGLSQQLVSDRRLDIRRVDGLVSHFQEIKPDVVFHLAAQSLVRLSFEQPVETFETNVLGTVNVLEAIRRLEGPCSGVMITTDKCYENREWLYAYRENDPMGGYDPYSASKGCAELAVSAYRRSYFGDHAVKRVATARAGNVIGGGDWARDRIVPDVFRALGQKKSLPVRNKHATRPWQHVLEPLSGYLWLAASLARPTHPSRPSLEDLCSGFNFGPNLASNKTVADLVQAIMNITGGEWTDGSNPDAPHEASKLNLAIDKAHHLLHWTPVWNFKDTVTHTVAWYQHVNGGASASQMTNRQIDDYVSVARSHQIEWASA